MDVRLVVEELGGFATRAALTAAGVTRHQLAVAVDEHRVTRLRRGVYGLGLPEGVSSLRAAAVALRAVVSHDSAAVLWGLDVTHEPKQRVTVPRNRSRARFAGVQVVRSDIEETEVRDGLRVTDVLRTVIDCATVLTTEDAVVIADSALRRGLVTIDELVTAAARRRGRHATRVLRVVSLADPRAESVLESLLRVLLVCAGLAPDEAQWVIRDAGGRFVARVDFVYLAARLIVEADGFDFHSSRDAYRKDRRKANAYCREDWSLLRFSWEDIRLDPDYVVDAVRAELAKPPRSLRRARQRQTNTQRAA